MTQTATAIRLNNPPADHGELWDTAHSPAQVAANLARLAALYGIA